MEVGIYYYVKLIHKYIQGLGKWVYQAQAYERTGIRIRAGFTPHQKEIHRFTHHQYIFTVYNQTDV